MHRFTMLICMTRRLISKPIAYFKFKCGKRIVQFLSVPSLLQIIRNVDFCTKRAEG